MLIYKITNLIDGKVYIGKRQRSKREFLNSDYYGSGKYIQRAIKKHGKENFKREILEYRIRNKDKLNEKEIYWIAKLNSQVPTGYNIQPGGGNNDSFTNNPNKEEIRKKFSKRSSGKNNAMYGISMYKRLINKYGELEGNKKYIKWKRKAKRNSIKNNPMKGKHWTKIWKEKYGEETANEMIKEKYEKISSSLKDANKNDAVRKSHGLSGNKNAMYGKSLKDIWIEKYGLKEAYKREKERERKRQETRKNNNIGLHYNVKKHKIFFD